MQDVTATRASSFSARFSRTSMATPLSTAVASASFGHVQDGGSGITEDEPLYPDDERDAKYQVDIFPKPSRRFINRRQQSRGRDFSQ